MNATARDSYPRVIVNFNKHENGKHHRKHEGHCKTSLLGPHLDICVNVVSEMKLLTAKDDKYELNTDTYELLAERLKPICKYSVLSQDSFLNKKLLTFIAHVTNVWEISGEHNINLPDLAKLGVLTSTLIAELERQMLSDRVFAKKLIQGAMEAMIREEDKALAKHRVLLLITYLKKDQQLAKIACNEALTIANSMNRTSGYTHHGIEVFIYLMTCEGITEEMWESRNSLLPLEQLVEGSSKLASEQAKMIRKEAVETLLKRIWHSAENQRMHDIAYNELLDLIRNVWGQHLSDEEKPSVLKVIQKEISRVERKDPLYSELEDLLNFVQDKIPEVKKEAVPIETKKPSASAFSELPIGLGLGSVLVIMLLAAWGIYTDYRSKT